MKGNENRVEFQQWLAQLPAWVPAMALVVGPLVASGAWSFDGWKSRLASIVIGGLIIIMGGWISHLREQEAKGNETSRQDLLDEMEEQELNNLLYLMDELITAVANTATPVPNNTGQRARDRSLSAARSSLLSQVKTLIGPSKMGVRANLFEIVEADKLTLRADTVGSSSQTRSTRTFTLENESVKCALAGKSRIVRDTAALEDECPYGTFATVPVLIDDQLFGLLTVDSPCSGDISDWDVKLMEFFGFMFAILYALEKTPKYVLRSDYLDRESTPIVPPVR